MKVKILYIINLGFNHSGAEDESREVSTGLYLKHKDRCDAVGVFWMTSDSELKANREQLNGPLPLKDGAPGRKETGAVAAQELLGKTPAKAEGEQRSVGVYIVSHGPAPNAPAPEEVAKSIDKLLPPEAKPKLHYVAVVACRLAEPKDTEGNFDLNHNDATYMMKFMKALNALDMRPVAAGWDVFISAAPHKPEPEKPISHGTESILVKDLPPGKKYVKKTGTTYETVGNEFRKLHKHLYQVTSDNRLRIALGTWSTFTGTSTQ